MLGNTPRKETVIPVEAGKSYAFGMRFRDPNGKPIDLADAVVRMVVANPGGGELMVLEAVHIADLSGLVQFQFQAADLSLAPAAYPFDITILPSSGYSTPLVKGYVEVGSNTDQDSSNVYDKVDRSTEISVVMGGTDVVEIVIERVDGMYEIIEEMLRDALGKMHKELAAAKTAAAAAESSAVQSQRFADELREWLTSVGYPFWQGSQSEYDSIPSPAKDILYLIVGDPV